MFNLQEEINELKNKPRSKMNKLTYFFVLATLLSCSRFMPVQNIPQTNPDGRQTVPKNELTEQELEWLVIGGQRIENSNRSGEYEHYLKTEAETIRSVAVKIDPGDAEWMDSLDGIEQLINLGSLHLASINFDMLDYSPLNSLLNLRSITFMSARGRELSSIPDLSGLAARELITKANFDHFAMANIDNIEFLPNLRTFTIIQDSGNLTNIKAIGKLNHLEKLELVTRNGVFRFEDIAPLPQLTHLELNGKQVDIKGIEQSKLLKELSFGTCDVLNTRFLSELKNVESLYMRIREPEPDISFLEGMTSLKYLEIYADDGTWGTQEVEKYQILDLGPIRHLSELIYFSLQGFILQNVAALDNLENLETAYAYHSVLKDSSEITKIDLVLYPDFR